MTKSTYKRLRIVQWFGAAVLLSLVVGGWLKLVPFGVIFGGIIILGPPVALAGWVLRDQDFEELPE